MAKTPRSPTERLRYSLDDLGPPITRLNRRLVWVLIALSGAVMGVFSLTLSSPDPDSVDGLNRPLAQNARDPWWEKEPDGVVQAPKEAPVLPPSGPVRSASVQVAMDSPLTIAVTPPGARSAIDPRRPSANPVRGLPTSEPSPSNVAGTLDVKAGTLISAALLTAIDSELPGPVIAQVTDDVRDTVSSNYVLIPKGSRLLCDYQSAAVKGQSRLVVACSRLLFPNGESQSLDGEPASDLAGAVGVPGKVNRHLLSTFGTATLLAVISAGVQISQGSFDNAGTDPREILAGSLGQQLGQTTNEILRRDLNRPPTIEVAAGTRFAMHVTQDLHFDRPYAY